MSVRRSYLRAVCLVRAIVDGLFDGWWLVVDGRVDEDCWRCEMREGREGGDVGGAIICSDGRLSE